MGAKEDRRVISRHVNQDFVFISVLDDFPPFATDASSSTTPPTPPARIDTPRPTSHPKQPPKIHDPSVPPKSLLKPGVLDVPRTHPVALVHFRTYHPPTLEFFLHFAYHAALALNIPLSHPARLPTQRSLFTVPKSPFIFKKAQENFEKKTHKRAVKVWNANKEVVDVWLRYLEEHMMPGIGMRVVRWEREEVGFGERRLGEVVGALRGGSEPSVAEQVRAIGERIIREETEAARKSGGIQSKTEVKEEESPKSG
ncbi:mitochondrial 37S ribosomal protein rsm10 [Ceratobasidium sp. 414]|nr:mitochondrial 37S ribosomal protein rsm10 [Ceratobasidium sp. 414]